MQKYQDGGKNGGNKMNQEEFKYQTLEEQVKRMYESKAVEKSHLLEYCVEKIIRWFRGFIC